MLAGAGYWGYGQWREWRAKQDLARDPARETTSPVITTNISFSVNAAGEIGPVEQVSVRPQINGLITKLPVDIGDIVKKDDLLFALDDKELQNQRASVASTVQQAKLQLEQAQRNYRRSTELYQSKLVSQETFDDTKTAYDLAKTALERAEKDLGVIEEQLKMTQVQAPYDCTILTRPVSNGQAVSGSGGFNSGTEVLTIADLNSMMINAQVNQADVPRLKVNQQVEVTIEAVPGLIATGSVERIAPQATIKNNIKGFAVRVLLKHVDHRVRPGMTANVRIPVAEADNVLAVPLAAVFTERDPETGEMQHYVYVKNGDGFERRDVQVGVSDYFYAEIQKGLSPGEVVSLEMPKEEQAKQAKSLAALPPGGGQRGIAAVRPPPKTPAVKPAGTTNTTTRATPASVPGSTRVSPGGSAPGTIRTTGNH